MRLKLFYFLLGFFLSVPYVFSSETGWIEKGGYYKPYVKINLKSCLVLFITEKGKVYRGRCRKSSPLVTPVKTFIFPERITYVVVKLSDFSFPQVLETGRIER